MFRFLTLALVGLISLSACTTPNSSMNPSPQEQRTNEVRKVSVLTEVPGGMCLRSRTECLVDISEADLNWTQTMRGYEVTVELPLHIFSDGHTWLALVHADGHGDSEWGFDEINYLRRNDVEAPDSACLAGVAWCATRDL